MYIYRVGNLISVGSLIKLYKAYVTLEYLYYTCNNLKYMLMKSEVLAVPFPLFSLSQYKIPTIKDHGTYIIQ